MLAAQAAGNWLEAFYFVDLGVGKRTFTVKRLQPGVRHAFLVATKVSDGVYQYSSWVLLTPAGVASPSPTPGFCPVTGLPLGADGYQAVNDTVSGPWGRYTLRDVTYPASVQSVENGRYFPPGEGRAFVRTCGDYHNTADRAYYFTSGYEISLDSDAGVGFFYQNYADGSGSDQEVQAGSTARLCQTWTVPETAQVLVIPVALGVDQSHIHLYHVERQGSTARPTPVPTRVVPTLVPTRVMPTPTFAPTPTPAGMSKLEPIPLRRLVEQSLGRVEACYSNGKCGTGTGFVVRADGLMVTNRHVVNDADYVTVVMEADDRRYRVPVLGRGILADLAVLQLPAGGRHYPVLPLADADMVVRGTEVGAFGYPGASLSEYEPNATFGQINGVDGYSGDVRHFQTDTVVNPGYSGGPLVNFYGAVVGVNTWKFTVGSVEGANFAITSNEVRDRLRVLVNGGRDSEVYRNLRYERGYQVTIPRRWYGQPESSDDYGTEFANFGLYPAKLGSVKVAFLRVRSSQDPLADWALRWHQFLLDSGLQESQVSFRLEGSGSARRYILEYDWQADADACVERRREVIALPTRDPGFPAVLSIIGGVCYDVLSEWGGERDRILNSFRP